jgi:hypothetical protein
MKRLALPILYFACLARIVDGAQHRFEQSDGAESQRPCAYDPIRGLSQPNAKALQVGDKLAVETGLQSGDSFTVKALAKPDADLQTKPREILPVFALGDGRTELAAGIRRSPPPHSYQWWRALSAC